MFDEVLKKAKNAGFNVKEVVTDKDSSVKSIYLQHFPEGIVTFCSNHSSKTFHKDLQKIKQEKGRVNVIIKPTLYIELISYINNSVRNVMESPSVESVLIRGVSRSQRYKFQLNWAKTKCPDYARCPDLRDSTFGNSTTDPLLLNKNPAL